MRTRFFLVLAPMLVLTAPGAVVAGWDFNTNGNPEGWSNLNNINSLAATSGNLTGTAANNDPQLGRSGLSLTVGSGESWDQLIFRVRETEDSDDNPATNDLAGTIGFNATGLVVQFNNSGVAGFIYNSPAAFTAVDSGSGYFTVSLDISALPANTTITNIRLDPIGGASSNSNSQTQGNFFEVDFIQVTSVPEPTAALLGSLGLLGLLLRRR